MGVWDLRSKGARRDKKKGTHLQLHQRCGGIPRASLLLLPPRSPPILHLRAHMAGRGRRATRLTTGEISGGGGRGRPLTPKGWIEAQTLPHPPHSPCRPPRQRRPLVPRPNAVRMRAGRLPDTRVKQIILSVLFIRFTSDFSSGLGKKEISAPLNYNSPRNHKIIWLAPSEVGPEFGPQFGVCKLRSNVQYVQSHINMLLIGYRRTLT